VVRTQIYLTESERQALRQLSRSSGRSQSALIRQAIDAMLEQSEKPDRGALLAQARGMWRDRDDLPDFRALRREFDRFASDPT
jgi:hypothetical protein